MRKEDKTMDNVIDIFLNKAAEAKDWKLVLGYQWVLNASESSNIDILDSFLIEKAKGY